MSEDTEDPDCKKRLNLCHTVSNQRIISKVIQFTERQSSTNKISLSHEKRGKQIQTIIDNYKNHKQTSVAFVISRQTAQFGIQNSVASLISQFVLT